MKFKVGDKVKVIDSGKGYTTYKGWIREYGRPYLNYWVYGESVPKLNDIYEIKVIQKHNNFNIMLLLIQNVKNKKVYIISEDGVTLTTETGFTKKDLKDDDLVTLRNGQKGHYTHTGGVRGLSDSHIRNDLTNDGGMGELLDIVKVERPTYTTLFERKEEILDEAEKRYLRGVIRPFRDRITSVKLYDVDKNTAYLIFDMKDDDSFSLPNFKIGTMYKNMELRESYTLEELGL